MALVIYDIALKIKRIKQRRKQAATLNIKEYSLQNFKFKYTDEGTKLLWF
jgi:hypothetical protein